MIVGLPMLICGHAKAGEDASVIKAADRMAANVFMLVLHVDVKMFCLLREASLATVCCAIMFC